MENFEDLFRTMSFFQNVKQDNLNSFSKFCEIRILESKEILVAQGDDFKDLFYLVNG